MILIWSLSWMLAFLLMVAIEDFLVLWRREAAWFDKSFGRTDLVFSWKSYITF